MLSDIHDAITSLAAHGKELPAGLTQEMKDEVDKLVRCKHVCMWLDMFTCNL
jgi:hypothetical protein